ncbi:hypothetical protein [Streptomyces aureoverticillatus]|uniref:hypothetical protein n=1 Tax=Streptomyces aureoverticillatus TaxID=66871 RepID=UPI0013DA7351|nr:hypothetical protein [Streptomyces aureoverticillatus]QIB42658.1 hypothetical protein G3H79_05840 [Streptomyces aureoverticillatus]
MTTDLPKHAVQTLLSDDGRGAVLADAVAAASETERHSTFFQACAWDIASDTFQRLTVHLDDIAIERHDAEQRSLTRSGSVLLPASRHIHEVPVGAARTLAHALKEEVAEATVAVEEASRVRSRIACGHEDTLAPPTSLLGIRPPSPLDVLMAFHHQLGAARLRLNALHTEERRALDELAVEEERRRRAADAHDGVTLEAIDLHIEDDFCDLIADLAEGVPHPVPGHDGRDQPVTASLPDGRPAVFFPQHLPVAGHADHRPPPLPALGLPEVRHLSDLAHR